MNEMKIVETIFLKTDQPCLIIEILLLMDSKYMSIFEVDMGFCFKISTPFSITWSYEYRMWGL